jgi:hypothetical protein
MEGCQLPGVQMDRLFFATPPCYTPRIEQLEVSLPPVAEHTGETSALSVTGILVLSPQL